MWPEVSYWLAWIALGVAPGWALLRASGMAWPRTEVLAAAPGVSIVAVAAAAYLAEGVGAPVNPWWVMWLLLGAAAALYAGRRWRKVPPRWVPGESTHEPWCCWLVFLTPVVLFLLLSTLRELVILPPTVDDGVHHATWARLIYERETLSPAALYAPPVSESEPVLYPWGVHAWIALLARWASLEWIEVYWRSVLLLGSTIPLSVYVLASRVLPRGWFSVAAAGCSLLFFWIPFQPYLWGGMSLLAGTGCALPVARLALDAVVARRLSPLALAAGLGFGLLAVHPSQALGALWVATLLALAQRHEGRTSWRVPAIFGGGLLAVGLAFVVGATRWRPLAQFLSQAENTALQKGTEPAAVLGWLADLWFGRGPSAVMLGVLCAAGVVTAVARPTARVGLWLHGGLLLLAPLALGRTWLTALWYHDLERLWYLQLAALPLLAATGLWGLGTLIARLARRPLAGWTQVEAAWPVGLALVAGISHPYFAQIALRLEPARRFMASDRSYLEDFAWMDAHLPTDGLVLNAPGDWGLVLPFTGRQLAFANCQVRRSVAEHFWAFLAVQNVGSYDDVAHRRLRALGVGYVYAGYFRRFAVATRGGPLLDSEALDRNPGLERVYQSRTAQVYRVREQLAVEYPQTHVSLGQDSPARFEGFHPVEGPASRPIRWTRGKATVHVPFSLLPADEDCSLVLGLRRPRDFPVAVRWNGQRLRSVVEGIYAIPMQVHALEIRSPTFVPRELDDRLKDGRSLGVKLRGVSLECAQSAGGDGPARTVVVPLQGSEDAWFQDFHRVERDDGTAWRWTQARSVIYLREQLLPPSGPCVVNLALAERSPRPTTVSWNGRSLAEQSPGAYRREAPPGVAQLELSSKTHQLADGRRVGGVGLWRLGFHCFGSTQGGPPARRD
ncbi:MAG: hypothetical protein JRI68_01210 [Deltaproteobacteria bacterium]|nr:hypothetical protein [Deltaproteobacteria bacterium]